MYMYNYKYIHTYVIFCMYCIYHASFRAGLTSLEVQNYTYIYTPQFKLTHVYMYVYVIHV